MKLLLLITTVIITMMPTTAMAAKHKTRPAMPKPIVLTCSDGYEFKHHLNFTGTSGDYNAYQIKGMTGEASFILCNK